MSRGRHIHKRGALPRGAGGANCLGCGATAAADGTGRPITLKHTPGCPAVAELDCTHGADCTVHPDANAVHNFDRDATPQSWEAS